MSRTLVAMMAAFCLVMGACSSEAVAPSDIAESSSQALLAGAVPLTATQYSYATWARNTWNAAMNDTDYRGYKRAHPKLLNFASAQLFDTPASSLSGLGFTDIQNKIIYLSYTASLNGCVGSSVLSNTYNGVPFTYTQVWAEECQWAALHEYGHLLLLAHLDNYWSINDGQEHTFVGASGIMNQAPAVFGPPAIYGTDATTATAPVHLWAGDMAEFDAFYPHTIPPGMSEPLPGPTPVGAYCSGTPCLTSTELSIVQWAQGVWNTEMAKPYGPNNAHRTGMRLLSSSSPAILVGGLTGYYSGWTSGNKAQVMFDFAAMQHCGQGQTNADSTITWEGLCRWTVLHEYGHVLGMSDLESLHPGGIYAFGVATFGVMESWPNRQATYFVYQGGPGIPQRGIGTADLPVKLWPQDLEQLNSLYPYP